MDYEIDLKKLYPFHMRIALLITLVVFILGFMFIPEPKASEYKPKVQKIIEIQKLPPQLQNIAKPPPPPKPKMPVAAESDEEVEAETIETTDFTGFETKEAEVEFNPPPFVAYEVAPQPLNLEEVKKMTTYPESAKRLGIEGTVFLKLGVDKSGKVRKVILVRSLYPALDKIAMDMAWLIEFSPAMQRDQPVDVWISFPYTFTLED
jgi:protein TonB